MRSEQAAPQLPAPQDAPPRTLRRRLFDGSIGAVGGGLMGAAAALLADPPGFPVAVAAGVVAALGAVLGYRWGRGVVLAAAASLAGPPER